MKTYSVSKYVKDNNIPEFYFADDKIKSLKLASFPTILLIIKGIHFEEGDLDCETFRDKFLPFTLFMKRGQT